MSEGYLYDCKTKRDALDYALLFLDDNTSRLLISTLEEKYHLIINGSTPCSAIEDIEKALFDIAGVGAELIITRLHTYLFANDTQATNAT